MSDAGDGKGCVKCATKDVVLILTAYMRDIRAAKKSGKWSKEEKKALKAEVKGFLKEVKRDVKQTWKSTPESRL